ncbi:MAG: minichromosome maintenance protein MCM [Candidatus Parvarchaeota archaeon]|nr:minichromosome maintenance protein MCM [Candidatus Parvarchaeota archaeon]MCL5101598.1 minichromosome maintenance protein MCM [Candidatus Parvarchaeota archaeon]
MKSDFDDQVSAFINKRLLTQLKAILATSKASIVIDFKDIDEFSPELGDFIIKTPLDAMDTIKYFINELGPAYKELNLEVRLKNLPKTRHIKIREIRSKHIGKLVQVTGLIKLAVSVKPTASKISFECQSCGHAIDIVQTERVIKQPVICTNCGKKGRFKIISKEFIDTQRINLEESPEDLEGGEQPEHVNIILKGDLVDPKFERSIIPGNKVTISGIINEEPVVYPSGKKARISEISIDASYLEAVEQGFEEMIITKEEELAIKEMAKDKLIYTKFRESMAPNIYGYDYIKDSIVLQLFGGVRKVSAEANSTKRGDVHILLVGDPGVAKSDMLKYVSGIAPKARYVTGMGSSGAGLTATIIKDDASKSYILEAGAMPLTNLGLLCIDEIDKMNKDDRVALHEGLEQQTISISKANIHSTLSAQTSVLAAANPKLSRFNMFEPVATQIDLPPTLINRFDLIFILKDRPNPEIDKMIASRILESNKDINKNKPAIETKLLKKYVAYAKQNCKPILSSDAISVINDFYLKLRQQHSTENEELKPIPISPRQLNAVIRLAEASAKVRLSEYVTVEDAKRAIDLTMAYLGEVGVDKSTGELDIDRVISGIPSSKRNVILRVKSIITSELNAMPSGGMISINKIYEDALNENITEDSVNQAIDTLKREGDIFEPRQGFLKLVG